MTTVDRLSLRFSGLSGADARDAGQRLAARLGDMHLEPSRAMHVGRLHLKIEARPGESADELVDRIACEIRRSLGRSL